MIHLIRLKNNKFFSNIIKNIITVRECHEFTTYVRSKKKNSREEDNIRAATLALFLHILVVSLATVLFRPRVFLNNFPHRRRQPRTIT